LVSIVLLWIKQPAAHRRQALKRVVVYLLLVGVAALAVFSLQLSVWKVLYGSFITIPQGNTFIDWRPLFLTPLLFSSFRGLLPWMPVFFLAVIGLLALSRKRVLLGLPLFIMMLLAVYINGSTRDWFAGGGYGPRRLTSELALLVVGYAAFLQLIPYRFRSWATALLGIGLALQQWLLLRFGLAEGLGGRVMSMAPTFQWEDDALIQFAGDVLALVPRIWEQPLDFLVFSSSPLDFLLRQQTVPVQHIATLLSSALFLLLVSLAVIFLAKRSRQESSRVVVMVLTVICLGLANLWILVGS